MTVEQNIGYSLQVRGRPKGLVFALTDDAAVGIAQIALAFRIGSAGSWRLGFLTTWPRCFARAEHNKISSTESGVLRAPPEPIRNNPLNDGSNASEIFIMQSLEQADLALDELAKLTWLRHDQSFMPEPLPLIISLKRWREANGFSQSEAVRVLNQTGIAVTLDSLQNWESGRRNPRASVALALADFLRQNPKVSKKSPRRPKPPAKAK
jgi:DNA-binding transcriptional regulator YiaG